MENALAEAQDRDDGMGNLFTLLSALMDHDQDLSKVINDLQAARISGNLAAIEQATRAFGQRVSIVNSGPNKSLTYHDDSLHMSFNDLSEKLTQRVLERLADSFSVRLGNLDRFIEAHQHSRVPNRYIDDQGFALGSWMDSRRKDKRVGRLSKDRLDALNARKVVWEVLDEQFSIGLASLDRFIETHQHSRVSRKYTDDQGFKLGSWMGSRRKEQKAGRLSKDRMNALNDRNVVWDKIDEKFNLGLTSLDRFIERHQHSRVPNRYTDDQGFALGSWMGNRRREKKADILSKDRTVALNDRNVVWDAIEEQFSLGLASLDLFIETHQHSRVPNKYTDDQGFALGSWMSSRRQEQKNGRLSKDCLSALNARNVVWEIFDEQFTLGLASLDRFIEKHQHSRVSQRYIDDQGFALGSWMGNRRIENKADILSKDRTNALDARNVVWDAIEEQFSLGLASLDRFIEKHQHSRVSQRYTDDQGFALGRWMSSRRQEKKAGRLSKARLDALNARNIVWEIFDEQFALGLASLDRFIEKHQHSRVSQRYTDDQGFGLGKWMHSRRQEHKADILSKDRTDALNARNVVWEPLDEQFTLGLASLDRFIEAHHHSRVSNRYIDDQGFALGSWISVRRKEQKSGRLSNDRAAQLNNRDPHWATGGTPGKTLTNSVDKTHNKTSPTKECVVLEDIGVNVGMLKPVVNLDAMTMAGTTTNPNDEFDELLEIAQEPIVKRRRKVKA